MKIRRFAKRLWKVLKASFKGFGDHKVPKLSGSLAYYTVFSMGPMLIVLIYLSSLFLERSAVESSIYDQMNNFVGNDTAKQLEQIIKNASLDGKSNMAAVIGIIALLIGATTVFAEIQDSINTIWGLQPKPQRKGLLILLRKRLLSFSVIVSIGFLLLVSLAVSTLLEVFHQQLRSMFPGVAVGIIQLVNFVVNFLVIAFLFGLIFKVLPDAEIKWKDIRSGAIVTALLFMAGKWGISFYISTTNVGSTYGAAGSLVILLLWVYLSAFILYFGAEFTKAYAIEWGSEIHPNKYTVSIKEVVVETGDAPVQHHED